MISETFCSIPWVHIAVSTSGSFRPCCNVTYSKEDYTDEDPYGGFECQHYIFKENIAGVWNSDTYKNFRKRMINGEKIAACSRCYREEESGIVSSRMKSNINYPMSDVNEDGFCSLDSIKYLDVRVGNKCNLKCRMCNPFASSMWIDDERKTHLRGSTEKDLDMLEKMDWYKSDLFWDNLISILDSCELIYFSGGEPAMFSEQQYRLFDECIKRDVAKNISLRYNTNITILQPKLIEYWKQFKGTAINCSLDAVGDVNYYIRYPSKWDIIDKNMKTLYELQDSHNIKVSVHCTVQILNILDLVNLLDYLSQYNIFPFLNLLNHPKHYNIKVLHKEQKDKATSILKSWCEENEDKLKESDPHGEHKKLLSILDYMNKDDWSHLYGDFLHETKLLDELRNQKLEDYIPELGISNDK